MTQRGAHGVVFRELDKMLGGEDPGAVQVTRSEGGEDLGSLAEGTGHVETLTRSGLMGC